MNKFKDLVQKKKNNIAEIGLKILEEEEKRPAMGSQLGFLGSLTKSCNKLVGILCTKL